MAPLGCADWCKEYSELHREPSRAVAVPRHSDLLM
jgi:hypothetical protein